MFGHSDPGQFEQRPDGYILQTSPDSIFEEGEASLGGYDSGRKVRADVIQEGTGEGELTSVRRRG